MLILAPLILGLMHCFLLGCEGVVARGGIEAVEMSSASTKAMRAEAKMAKTALAEEQSISRGIAAEAAEHALARAPSPLLTEAVEQGTARTVSKLINSEQLAALMANVREGTEGWKLLLEWEANPAYNHLFEEAYQLLATCVRSGCFPAGVKVLTKDGPRPIETLKARDPVLARNETTGEQGYYPIKATVIKQAYEWVHTSYQTPSGEVHIITSTPDHPFWVASLKQWIHAGDLKAGMRLSLADGTEALIQKVEKEAISPRGPPPTVYNLTVEDAESFFVLPPNSDNEKEGVWVHNLTFRCPLTIWAMGWGRREEVIRHFLNQAHHTGAPGQLGGKFPVIDYWNEAANYIRSVRSMDLGPESGYLTHPDNIKSQLKKYWKGLEEYTVESGEIPGIGRGRIEATDKTVREMFFAIPQGIGREARGKLNQALTELTAEFGGQQLSSDAYQLGRVRITIHEVF